MKNYKSTLTKFKLIISLILCFNLLTSCASKNLSIRSKLSKFDSYTATYQLSSNDFNTSIDYKIGKKSTDGSDCGEAIVKEFPRNNEPYILVFNSETSFSISFEDLISYIESGSVESRKGTQPQRFDLKVVETIEFLNEKGLMKKSNYSSDDLYMMEKNSSYISEIYELLGLSMITSVKFEDASINNIDAKCWMSSDQPKQIEFDINYENGSSSNIKVIYSKFNQSGVELGC